jgi:hypothetical protein
MNVLAQLRLTKLLDLHPTPKDVEELQDIDWLIKDTEVMILEEEKKEVVNDC